MRKISIPVIFVIIAGVVVLIVLAFLAQISPTQTLQSETSPTPYIVPVDSPLPTVLLNSTRPFSSEVPQTTSFRMQTYGVELTSAQHTQFISQLPKVAQSTGKVLSVSDTNGKWFYWDDSLVIQTYEYFRNDATVCQMKTAWCGSAGVAAQCANYSLREDDWDRSNNSACCRAYVRNVESIFACSTLSQTQEFADADYERTISVLKSGGVNCAQGACGPKASVTMYIPQ